MRRTRAGKRRAAGRLALLAVLVLALIGCGVGIWLESRRAQPQRGEMSEHFGRLPTVEWNGQTWQKKPEVTGLLLIGYDHNGQTRQAGFRSGGQADFLLLLAIDDKEKTIRPLHIERDAMTAVTTLGITGQETGRRVMQICLSHGFGADAQANCGYTVEAVEGLLPGADIELYMAMDISGIGQLNDVLGGVTVTLEDDFTALDPAMAPGATLRLTGQQAEWFVRQRMGIGQGTNESRMRRQQAYMEAAGEALKNRMAESASFAETLFDALSGVMDTNMTRGRMINEVNRAWGYTLMPVEKLSGEYRIGEDGFMEFHVTEGAGAAWAAKAFYRAME